MYAVPLVWAPDLLGVLKVENPRNARYFSHNDHRKCDLNGNLRRAVACVNKEWRMKLVPGMAHILNSPAAGMRQCSSSFNGMLAIESTIKTRCNEQPNWPVKLFC